MNDNEIIKYFYGKKEIIKHKLYEPMPEEIEKYLNDRFSDSFSTFETVFRIRHQIEHHPTCPICGNFVKFVGKPSMPFQKFCCRSCLSKYTAILNEQRYGTRSTLTLERTKEKTKETLLKHYGVDHNWKSVEVRKKCDETAKNKYGENYRHEHNIDKMRITKLNVHGKENYVNISKMKETNKNLYGVDIILKKLDLADYATLNSWKLWYLKKIKNDMIYNRKKSISCKKHSMSGVEINVMKFFDKMNIKYENNFYSEKYPFNVDFYLNDYDTYIEIQGHQTHGLFPYDKHSEFNDLMKATYGKECAYFEADIEKRNIAKKNNLNYVEIFSINKYFIKNSILEYLKNPHGYEVYVDNARISKIIKSL